MRVIALSEEIRAGKHIKRHPWTEFQLLEGDYDEIEHQLERDEVLLKYVKDNIRCVCRKNGQSLLATGRIWQCGGFCPESVPGSFYRNILSSRQLKYL